MVSDWLGTYICLMIYGVLAILLALADIGGYVCMYLCMYTFHAQLLYVTATVCYCVLLHMYVCINC